MAIDSTGSTPPTAIGPRLTASLAIVLATRKEADAYVLTTLILASALFFAGITTSFRVRFARLLLLVGATLLIAYAAARLGDLSVV
jgi:hypothetical protein